MGTDFGDAAHQTGMQKRTRSAPSPTASGAPDVTHVAEQLDRLVSGLVALREQLDLVAPRCQEQPSSMLLSPEEAAIVLGIGRSSVYRLLDSGDLRRVSIGRSTRIPRADVDAYVARLLGESA